MLDSDLADLYGIETKILNRAVKRNHERFPENFMFQLNNEEWNDMRFQIGTSKEIKGHDKKQGKGLKPGRGGRRYLPKAFTEQGVAMLSAVLNSAKAIKVSISIMEAFVEMRRFLTANGQVFERLNRLEMHQFVTDKKLDKALKSIEINKILPKQGIFFDGQIFDAFKLVSDLIRSAEKSIVLIDNYIDDSTLTLFSKRKKNVALMILTKKVSEQLTLDMEKFNSQYPPASVKVFDKAHDRFLIIDGRDVYHFGASLKDLGKKWFAFSKMENEALSFNEQLKSLNKVN